MGVSMDQSNPAADNQFNEDAFFKSQMEKVVDSYDSIMRRMTLGRERVLRQRTVDLAPVRPGDSVLEVGCGTGSLTLAAKRKVGPAGQVFGIDLIPGMIEISRRKADQANLDVGFQLGSIDSIPFPASQFDVVLCSFMIFHMSAKTRQKGLTEIYRVLKPRGHLFVLDMTFPTNRLFRALAKRLLGSMLEHELRELLPVMESAGFSALETGPFKFGVMRGGILSYVRGGVIKD